MLYAMMIGSISTTGEKAAIVAPIFFLFALVGTPCPFELSFLRVLRDCSISFFSLPVDLTRSVWLLHSDLCDASVVVVGALDLASVLRAQRRHVAAVSRCDLELHAARVQLHLRGRYVW